ncbi:NAD(P)-dependent oxidoreductase [Flexivirga meconopsidis]|uniref:NAD(P)-dependent oxidoreductase n=1 Tax=Flexivirga meconopsidis TaxID=2977121 RepID=UPI002240919D|nr:NAD(P)H-binding protein [Flexivirga meconopsidis]
MEIAVCGATGNTGRAVVAEAVRRGLLVRAIARSATAHPWPAGVSAQAVDVTDAAAVRAALDGVDAVVFAVGHGSSRERTELYSRGIRNVLAALGEDRPLSVISAAPVAPRASLPLPQRIVAAVLWRFFGATYTDMRRMEAELRGSTADWTCLRPPRLTAGRARGAYQIGARPEGASITHADLAAALLDALDRPELRRQLLFVAN